MRSVKIILLMFGLFVIAACGGGGGGGGGGGAKTNVNVAPDTVAFDLNINSMASKSVNVTFKGDALFIGYPPDVPAVYWLGVGVSDIYSSPAEVVVQALTYGMSAGTYTTTIRFVTGLEDGSNIVYQDVPVSLTVKETAVLDAESIELNALESVVSAEKIFNITTKSATDWSLSIVDTGFGTDWLTLSKTSGSLDDNSTTAVSLSGMPLRSGNYTATIVLKDGGGVTLDTMSVVYTVSTGISVTGSTSKSITEAASLADLQLSIPLQSEYDPIEEATINWTLMSSMNWLKVVSSSGNLGTEKNLELILDADELLSLPNGDHSAILTLAFGNSKIWSINIPVTLSLNLNPQLTVIGDLDFILDNSTTENQLQKTVQISSNVGAAFERNMNWHVALQSDWLKAINTEGNLTSQSSLQLQVAKDALPAISNDLDSALVVITADHPAFKPYEQLVALHLNASKINSVSPYVGFVGQSGPVVLTGSNFSNQIGLKVDVDGVLVDAIVENDSTIRLDYPAISTAKNIKFKIPNTLNLDRGEANFIIKDVPEYNSVRIPVGNKNYNITLDAERQAVLLIGYEANEVTKVALVDGNWQTTTLSVPDARSMALTSDGKELLVLQSPLYFEDRATVVHVDPKTLSVKDSILASSYYDLDFVVPMRDGTTKLLKLQHSIGFEYPSMNYFYLPHWQGVGDLVLSRDRSILLFGDTNSPDFTYSYDGFEFTQRSLNSISVRSKSISMSTDGGRVVAENTVFDKNFNILGQFSEKVEVHVTVSPDGRYAYVLTYTPEDQPLFIRYDISGASGPYIGEELNISLEADHIVLDMTVSDDGKALFILTHNYKNYAVDYPALLNIAPLNN